MLGSAHTPMVKRRMPGRALVGALAVAIAIAATSFIAAQQRSPLSTPDPASPLGQALQRGEAALLLREYMPALEAFKQAKKLEAQPSANALYGMARAYQGLGAYKDEIDACNEALKYVQGDEVFESRLHNQLGIALAGQAGKNADKLKAAEAELRASVAAPRSQPIGWYNLGVVLLKQNRDDEGKEALERYLASRPTELTEIALAKGMIDNPRRAREPLAPDFTV